MNYTIREILKNLYQIETPNGLTEDELTFLENKFGKLPKALREFYALCGNCNNVMMNQDMWIVPKDYQKWKRLNDNKYMLLLNENQSCYIAAILENDFGKEDPFVYVSDDCGESWKVCADSAEKFLKAALIYEAVFSFQYSSKSYYWITEDGFEILKEKLTLLPFYLDNWFGKVWLFQDLPNSAAFVLEVDGDFQMLYGAVSEESFCRLANKLEGIGEEL